MSVLLDNYRLISLPTMYCTCMWTVVCQSLIWDPFRLDKQASQLDEQFHIRPRDRYVPVLLHHEVVKRGRRLSAPA
jgi:hypothetical protein